MLGRLVRQQSSAASPPRHAGLSECKYTSEACGSIAALATLHLGKADELEASQQHIYFKRGSAMTDNCDNSPLIALRPALHVS